MANPITLEEMKQFVERPEKNYAIGKYPVTQALWESVMGENPSKMKGFFWPKQSYNDEVNDRRRPVEKVTWFDC